MVLLAVEHVCTRDAIPLDWNKVANLVAEDLTGEAIKQHLFKLRKARTEEGMKNPPDLDRKAAAVRKSRSLLGGSLTPVTPRSGRKRKTDTMADDDIQTNSNSVNKSGSLLYTKQSTKKSAPKLKNTAPKKEYFVKIEHNSDSEPAVTPTKKGKGYQSRREGLTSFPSSNNSFDSAVPTIEQDSKVVYTQETMELRPTFPVDYSQQPDFPQQRDVPQQQHSFTTLPEDVFSGTNIASSMPMLTGDIGLGVFPPPNAPILGNFLPAFGGSYYDYGAQQGFGGFGEQDFSEMMPEEPLLSSLGDSFAVGGEMGDFGGVEEGEELPPLFPGFQ